LYRFGIWQHVHRGKIASKRKAGNQSEVRVALLGAG
jgi:hypothetical protein